MLRMLKIYMTKTIKKIEEKQLELLFSLISKERAERAKRFHSSCDAAIYALSELLARYAIFDAFGISEIKINSNKYGKPLLEEQKGMHFNVSHSGDIIVCAVSSYDVGIDIEFMRECNYLKIAKRVFSESEYLFLHNSAEREKKERFFEIWTMKESYIKYIGKGFSLPLNSFSVDFESKPIRVLDADKKRTAAFIKQYKTDDLYKLAVCSNSYEFCDNIIELKYNELF